MSDDGEDWVSWLSCPRCAGKCTDTPPVCTGCGFAFPTHGSIPLVTARPHELAERWSAQLAEFEASGETGRLRIIADAATSSLHPATRARLERLAAGMASHRERVVGLLAAAGIVARKRVGPEPEGVPGESSISAYIHHIHRDWGWDQDGSHENREALDAVAAVLGAAPRLGRVLVLGAGACRLAYDLHRHGHAEITIAVDVNPLPMIVARRVIAGEAVGLVELPLAPPDLARVAVDRQLRAPVPLGSGFVQLFADAFALPFRDHSFDTVVTPWFIDQVPRDLAAFLPEIRRMLREGGRWLNHGPLIYNPSRTPVAARYASDELFALIDAAGFVVEARREDRLTYLQSPACTRGRRELVLSFVARVGGAVVTASSPASGAPAWLDDPSLPVPRFEGLDGYAAPHPLFATVAGLVDGRRSTQAIAAVMIRDFALPADVATAGVASALREIWRATR